MPRRRKARMSQSLGGKLEGFRREVQRVMDSLRREIATRESELSELKAEYGRVMEAFGRGPARGPEPRPAGAPRERGPRRARRRAPALDWKQVYASLPARFTLETLTRHPKAGQRSKPHLYAIISRWKKERKIAKNAAGGYRKVEAAAKPGRGPRAKPSAAPKTAAPKGAQGRAESPAA